MIGYIYNSDNRQVIARLHGCRRAIERKAEFICADEVALTFQPAFGTADGLIVTDDTYDEELGEEYRVNDATNEVFKLNGDCDAYEFCGIREPGMSLQQFIAIRAKNYEI